MSTINPYTQAANAYGEINKVQKTERDEKPAELSRADIISSKNLTPEQKLEMLGIQKMTPKEMAEGLVKKIEDGEI